MAENQDVTAVEALTQQLNDALNGGDFPGVGEIFSNDAVLLPPISNVISGRGNIEMFWQRAQHIREVKFETMSVKPLGDQVLREVGTLNMKMSGAGGGPPGEGPQGRGGGQMASGQPRNFAGKYIFVWQKIDAHWKLSAAIWNRIGSPRKTFPLFEQVRQPGQPGQAGQRGGGRGRNFRPPDLED